MVNSTLKFKSIILASFTFIFLNLDIQAQDGFDEFIEAGSADASSIYKAYGTPLLSGVNWAFSRGWYNTAKAHKTLGFDFSLNVSIAFVPSKDEFYNTADVVNEWNANAATRTGTSISGQPLSDFPTRFAAGANRFPTMVGPQEPAPIIEIFNPATDQYEQIEGPVGFDYANDIVQAAVPVAMPQFGIGLFKNTDLKFRFLPEVGSDDVKLSMFGVGLMHDIKQWIPGNSLIPIDISLFGAYSNTNFDVLDIDDAPGDDAFFKQSSWTAQLLVSKELHIITFYGGFGINSGTNNIEIVGEYDIIASSAPIRDPIDIETTDTGFTGSFGIRLKLAIITLHADYAIQEYNTVNTGIGISLR